MSDPYAKARVRASVLHFFFGKALNAVLSFATLLLLVRLLVPADYGAYIALLALQSTLLALSSLGIDSTAERFLPELRMQHHDTELPGFVIAALLARSACLLAALTATALLLAPLCHWTGLHSLQSTVALWLPVIAMSGLLAFSVALLEAMLQQGPAQTAMACYTAIKLSLLLGWLGLPDSGALALMDLIAIEAIATMAALLWALRHLLRSLTGSGKPGGLSTGLKQGLAIVRRHRQRLQRFAFFNYVAQVVFQLFNAEMMKLLVTRLLGLVQAAAYGFVYSLSDTVQRYLPAVLLLRLIKPVFISRYTASGDFAVLNSMARLVLKLNLLVLLPLLACCAVWGAELLQTLSHGKYTSAHGLLTGVLALLILSSHQLVLSLLASTLERNAMQLYAGMTATLALPLALWLLPSWGANGALIASAISGLCYNLFATHYLRRAGFAYSPDLRGAAVLILAGLLAATLLWLGRVTLGGGAGLCAGLLLAAPAYLLLVRRLQAFSDAERQALNSVLPKPVFIF